MRHELNETELVLFGESMIESAECPDCGFASKRRNATYWRHPADLPCLGYRVRLKLRVKRFFCANGQCERVSFCERFPELLTYKARRTRRLQAEQLEVGFEVGGEAGRRILERVNMPVSGDTLLRDIRATPEAEVETPRVLGIDDWAKRKGHNYGTILVDLESGNPIDVLDSREAADVETWLKAHPGIEIISRDRSKEYKKGVTAGAPEAEQVADRFHILKNLRDATETFIRQKPRCLQAAGNHQAKASTIMEEEEAIEPVATDCADPQYAKIDMPAANKGEKESLTMPPKPLTKAEQVQLACRQRKQARYEQVRQMHQTGQSMRAIATELNMSTRTVKRYIHADECPTYTTGTPRPSKLDKFLDILETRWRQGCTNASQLWRELRDQHGFSGSRGLVARWAANQRQLLPPDVRYARQQSATIQPQIMREVKPSPWSACQVSWLLFHEKMKLDENQLAALDRVLDSDAQTKIAYEHIQNFRHMLKNRCVDKLDDWLAQLSASGISGLSSFANGIKQDLAEVKNAFTMLWSNGPTEGHVNRLKFIKRQMYGRANFDLLRKRILYRPCTA